MQGNKELSTYKHRAVFALWLLLLAAGFIWAAAATAQEPDEGVPLESNAAQCGMSVYDWNGLVTEREKGFPRHNPPQANGDWTKPIDYSDGTFYFRAQIFNQPKPQNMKLQFCVWQDNNDLENCADKADVSGQSGTVVTWNTAIADMWKKGRVPIDWTRPRHRDGVAIKNSAGDPVSNLSGWEWSGEKPEEWYPLRWRFTVRVVPDGAQFAGWAECLDSPTAVTLSGMDAQGPSGSAAAPVLLMLAAALAVISLAAVRHTGLFKRQV